MMYLRKINPDAWEGKQNDDSDSISDIATTNHELSVWEVPDPNEINSIALALAMTRSDPKPFMGVLLDPDDIQKTYGWKPDIQNNPGNTMFKAKKNYHKDFILENVDHMIKMADYIHSLIKTQDLKRIFNFNELELIKEAEKKFDSKEITEEELNKEQNKGSKWGKLCREYNNRKKQATS